MSKLIVLASIQLLFSVAVAKMEGKGFNPVNDLSNFNDLKPDYILENSYIVVAVRNKEGKYPDIHKLPLTEGTPLNLNVFSQEYVKKALPKHDIEIIDGERFSLAIISNKIPKKEEEEPKKEEPQQKKENNKK